VKNQKLFFWGLVNAVVLLLFVLESVGSCAEVRGQIRAADGAAVSGVSILIEPQKKTAIDPNFRLVAFGAASASSGLRAISKSDGSYALSGLKPGNYVMKLEPAASGFKAGEAVAAVGKDGLTVNWIVSKKAPALAFASRGVTSTLAQIAGPGTVTPSLIPGLSAVQSGLVVGAGASAVILGGTIGGIAAAGGFSGPKHPASPSL